MNYNELLNRSKLMDSNVLNVFQYGSRVYSNFNSKSDYDFIVIVKNKEKEQFSDNLININFYTAEEHQNRLKDHEISALECYFLDPQFIWKNTKKYTWKLDLSKLRCALSAKSSNSWVKAKKKLTVEKDYDLSIGKKSLFHSFRIIKYGIQIATTGAIYNYAECNELYNEIMNNYDDWYILFEEYKERYNNLLTEFRKVAPK